MDFRRVKRIIRAGRLMALASPINSWATTTWCRLSLITTSSECTTLEIRTLGLTDVHNYGYGESGPLEPTRSLNDEREQQRSHRKGEAMNHSQANSLRRREGEEHAQT